MFLALGRAGGLGCGPAWHSPAPPRASRASAQRQDARGRGRGRGHMVRRRDPERGGRRRARECAGGRGAAGKQEARALRRPPPRSAAAPSGFSHHFSFSTPWARASPRSLNDAQVPPGAALCISLPSPKRDSPSTTTPCLQPPGLSAGGSGRKGERAREKGLRSRIPNYSFLWSLPRSRATPPPTFQQARPGPSGSGRSRRGAALTSSLGAGFPG